MAKRQKAKSGPRVRPGEEFAAKSQVPHTKEEVDFLDGEIAELEEDLKGLKFSRSKLIQLLIKKAMRQKERGLTTKEYLFEHNEE